MQQFRHAFAVRPRGGDGGAVLPVGLEKLAQAIVSRGMETPAIIFLEAFIPLSFLGSQAMYALHPVLKLAAVEPADYAEIAASLEHRGTLRTLAERIEALAAAGRGLDG